MKSSYRRRLAPAGAALLVLAGCADAALEPNAMKPDIGSDADTPIVTTANPDGRDPEVRARAAALDFSGKLRGTLQQAIQSDGVEAAVDVCKIAAPQIAEQVMLEHGVRLGRVALPGRNRNPRQAADGWQLGALQDFQAAVERGGAAAEQVMVQRDGLPDGVVLRMIRGIETETGCLACHGSAVAPSVREAIARHYPGDAATGFEIGDLRGALWVEVLPGAAQDGSDRHRGDAR
ncbi:hypothetical protein ACG33_02765 [Steroidobacter denitrificans]|uniref:Tll0287-like domain-containing protein n=2 Tax=Steroidobacter denitrificans TaxID=465721 RepID=A0A127F8W6_STEDE|nr:hypothetical protein ACG33_02765 [Steroidobacter denitrificans]